MNKKFLLLFFLTISLGFLHTAIAQTTWTNGGGDNLWSNDLNWSNGVPDISQDVIFDGTSSDDCLIDDAFAAAKSINLKSSFTGVVSLDMGVGIEVSDLSTFSGGTINFENSDASSFGGGIIVSGGVFNGADAASIIISRNLTISSGSFTAPSGELTIARTNSSALITGDSSMFNHNNGSVRFNLTNGNGSIPAGLTFNNVTILNTDANASRVFGIATNSQCKILGSLMLNVAAGDRTISFNGNNSRINLFGNLNVLFHKGTGNPSHTPTFVINLVKASGTQSIIGADGIGTGILPSISINNTGTATVTMSQFINVKGHFVYNTTNNVNTGTSTFTQYGSSVNFSPKFGSSFITFNKYNIGNADGILTGSVNLLSDLQVNSDFQIRSSSSLNTNNNGLFLAGNLTNEGTLNVGASIVNLSGSNGQFLQFRGSTDIIIHSLVCAKTGGTATIGDGVGDDGISISHLLSCTGGTLNLNGNVTLLSTVSTTAQVGTVSGTITGNATIERYIPAKATRKWHFLAAPVSSGASIRNSWQNQIYITGAGTGSGPVGTFNSNFFDWTVANSTSMYSYNENMNVGMNNRWVSVPNTNATNLNRGVGYRVFIRGARGDLGQLTGTVSNQTEVTLAATGNIPQGTQNIAITCSNGCGADDGWNLIGNPFPATLDWNLMSTTNSSITTGTYYVFDPINNAYVSWNGSVGGATRYISSGQSFWVKKSSSGSSNFQVTEAHKAVNQNGGSFFKTDNLSNLLTIKLSGTGFENNAYVHLNNSGLYTLDRYDAYKLSFGNNQIATFVSEDGTRLDINNLPEYGAKLIDTIEVDVKLPLAANNYTLNFNNVSSFDNALQVVLEDKLSNTYTDLKSNAVYAFTTNGNANSANNRFRILISNQSTPLPVTLTLLQAKLEKNMAVLNWSTLTEKNNAKFIVEHSVDGISYRKVGEVKGAGNSSIKVDYAFNHSKFSRNEVNYYRLKQVDYNGDFAYSNVAFVSGSTKQITPEFNNESGSTKLSLYPIPAQHVLSVEGLLTEQASVRISNMYGVEVYTKQVKANNGIAALDIEYLTAGVYVIEVKDENGNVEVMKFTKQ